MFSFLFLVNPGVISAIIGALIGSISAWTLSYFTEERKFNRKKKGAYALLKSEIEINVSNLKRYKKNYLIKNTKELYNNGNLNDINEFYYYLSKFPVLNHNNWDNLINFIPYIFDENQIKQIIQFNVKLEQLNKQSKKLAERGMPQIKYSGFYLYELDEVDYEVTLGTYSFFEININIVLNEGKNILNSFKKPIYLSYEYNKKIIDILFTWI